MQCVDTLGPTNNSMVLGRKGSGCLCTGARNVMWCCGVGIFFRAKRCSALQSCYKMISIQTPLYIYSKTKHPNETLLSTRFDVDKAPFPCMVCVMLMVELACEYTSYLHHKRGGTCRNVSHGWKLGYIKHPFTRPH